MKSGNTAYHAYEGQVRREDKEGTGVVIRPEHRRSCKKGDVTKFHGGRAACGGDAGRHEDNYQQVPVRKHDSPAVVRAAQEDA